jgi:hypothetical protein
MLHPARKTLLMARRAMTAAALIFQRRLVMPLGTSNRLAFAMALATLLAVVVVPGAAATMLSGSITASDPTHDGALDATTASTCAATNTVSVVAVGSGFHYDTYTLTNQSASANCVTVSYTASSNVFIAAYSPSFDPANLTQNFLGSTATPNGTTCGGTSGSFSFTVPASATFVVEVEECTPGAGVSTYSLDVTGTGVTAARFRSLSAAATARGTLVRWRTGTEAELLGFQVYRTRGHSWRRITHSLIAAKGSVSGRSYRFLDRTARRGVSYRIKAVNRDGTASWFGPVRVT